MTENEERERQRGRGSGTERRKREWERGCKQQVLTHTSTQVTPHAITQQQQQQQRMQGQVGPGQRRQDFNFGAILCFAGCIGGAKHWQHISNTLATQTH